MYVFRANRSFFKRHVDQLIAIDKTKPNNIDTDDDWYHHPNNDSGEKNILQIRTNRYPVRIRNPPVRLGIDD